MSKKGKHQTVPRELKHLVSWAESINEVKKLVIARMEVCRHSFSPGYVKLRGPLEGGFKVTGYSGNGVTDFFIRCNPSDREILMKKFVEKFNEK